jgi:hypothetical protein
LGVDPLVEGALPGRAAVLLRHPFDVPAGAETTAGASENEATNILRAFAEIERTLQASEHLSRKRIAPFGSVHGEHRHTVLGVGAEVLGSGLDLGSAHSKLLVTD